jgi:hypothetical protein
MTVAAAMLSLLISSDGGIDFHLRLEPEPRWELPENYLPGRCNKNIHSLRYLDQECERCVCLCVILYSERWAIVFAHTESLRDYESSLSIPALKKCTFSMFICVTVGLFYELVTNKKEKPVL